jgi:uncharacterized membrane protein YfcA
LTELELLVVLAVTAVGSLVHGTTGVGLGLVTGPFLLSIDPRFIPGPILLASVLIALRHLVAEGDQLDRATLTRIVAGMPVGAGLALVVLAVIDQRTMAIGIGIAVIVTAALLLRGVTFPTGGRSEVVAGVGATFGAVTAALPGPPLVMALHDREPGQLRPTVAASSVVIAAVTAASLTATGRFGLAELGLLALMVPAVLVGLIAARFVRPRIDQHRFRTAVLWLALAGGASLLIRTL